MNVEVCGVPWWGAHPRPFPGLFSSWTAYVVPVVPSLAPAISLPLPVPVVLAADLVESHAVRLCDCLISLSTASSGFAHVYTRQNVLPVKADSVPVCGLPAPPHPLHPSRDPGIPPVPQLLRTSPLCPQGADAVSGLWGPFLRVELLGRMGSHD